MSDAFHPRWRSFPRLRDTETNIACPHAICGCNSSRPSRTAPIPYESVESVGVGRRRRPASVPLRRSRPRERTRCTRLLRTEDRISTVPSEEPLLDGRGTDSDSARIVAGSAAPRGAIPGRTPHRDRAPSSAPPPACPLPRGGGGRSGHGGPIDVGIGARQGAVHRRLRDFVFLRSFKRSLTPSLAIARGPVVAPLETDPLPTNARGTAAASSRECSRPRSWRPTRSPRRSPRLPPACLFSGA